MTSLFFSATIKSLHATAKIQHATKKTEDPRCCKKTKHSQIISLKRNITDTINLYLTSFSKPLWDIK